MARDRNSEETKGYVRCGEKCVKIVLVKSRMSRITLHFIQLSTDLIYALFESSISFLRVLFTNMEESCYGNRQQEK